MVLLLSSWRRILSKNTKFRKKKTRKTSVQIQENTNRKKLRIWTLFSSSEKERKFSSCWSKRCLIHSKYFNTETNTTTNLPNETRFVKTKGRVYKIWFSGRNFESIYLTKFDATTRKLNHQYDIQFFAWYVSTKCVTARRKLNFWPWFHFVPYSSHVTWLYHVLCDTFTWRFCGGWVLQKVDINLLVFLENFWVFIPLGLFQILTILVLEYRCP